MRSVAIGVAVVLGAVTVAAGLVVPVLLLLRVDDETLNRWSQIGQAVSPVGVFFSGIAFIGIASTLFLQQQELRNQQSQLSVALEDQRRSSEVALRQVHTDLVKMAIDDEELLQAWPELYPGVGETRRDHYCNLVLNLQKVAYGTRTIELDELRGALRHLMTSPHMYAFWAGARQARIAVTGGDGPRTSSPSRSTRPSPPRRRPAHRVWRPRSGTRWASGGGHGGTGSNSLGEPSALRSELCLPGGMSFRDRPPVACIDRMLGGRWLTGRAVYRGATPSLVLCRAKRCPPPLQPT